MNLDSISSKYVGELEQTVHQLLAMMRKVKFQSDPLYVSLLGFEQELADIRCNRFDKDNSEYRGY